MKRKTRNALIAVFFIAMMTTAVAATNSQFTVYWSVPASYDHTISYDANCSGGTSYFVEHDSTIDGNQWKIVPTDDASRTNLCQGKNNWYFQVAITGTATTELDINRTNDQGQDVNLKVYQADSTLNGCGDQNCAGWEMPCSISDGQVTNITCLQVGTADGEFASIASGADQNYCMCADLNGSGTAVAQGDHQETVGITSRAPD